jgi:ATP-dependent Clp protease adaptor protein ClpS
MSPATETPVRKPGIDDPGAGLDAPWQVIVMNDDHNTFDGVAHALSAVLPGVGFEQGMAFANRIHSSGRAVVWSGHKAVVLLGSGACCWRSRARGKSGSAYSPGS